MPKFLDLFIREIRKKRESMREMIENEHTSMLEKDFEKIFRHHWHPLPNNEIEEFHLFAIDGSRGLREYANGSRFYVTRAFALSNKGIKLRLLETGIFLAKGSDEDVRRYLSQKTELVEMKLALEAASHLKGSRKVILIDGSLYGRMMHLPMDSPVEGDRALLIKYMDIYSKLLTICRDRNILLIGVSKDSRTEFLRSKILNHIYQDELNSLVSKLSHDEIKILERCIEKIEEQPDRSLKTVRRLKRKYGGLLDKFEEIIKEYTRIRPDFQLILRFSSNPGYCTPIELGPLGWIRKEFRSMAKKPERFVRRRFRNAIAENINREDEFIEHATRVITALTKFPTILSFHLLLNPRDTPLRIDVPSWVYGSKNTLSSFMKTQFVEANHTINEIISILRAGYAGLRNYNIWLKHADEEVKLHREDMDSLYERVLEKELGLTLIHTRGYRRVKYP